MQSQNIQYPNKLNSDFKQESRAAAMKPRDALAAIQLRTRKPLANSQVGWLSTQQQCVYEGPLVKTTTKNQRKEHVGYI